MAVLYRKYRPTKLQDVVGQEHITATLKKSLNQGQPAHAYLFIGPRGTGKTSVARILAHAINGFDYQVEDSYLDIIEIDAASNTGVDNIRELREKSIIAPTSGKYKVYIIDEVHMLTKSASNALLKTLEEPPEHVIFIMATTDAHKVPITISSRTQVFTFKLADPKTMLAHLRKISDAEKIPITDDALQIVVRRGGGSFRDSLSLLDQISSLADQEITAELLNTALGLPQDETVAQLLSAYTAHDSDSIRQLLKDSLNTGIKPEIIASEVITKVIDQPDPNLLPLLAKLPDVEPPFSEAKLLLAFLDPARPDNASGQNPPITTKIVHQSNPNLPPEPTRSPSKANTSQTADTPTPQPISHQKSSRSLPFDWDNFVNSFQNDNIGLHNLLQKVDYEFDGQTLHLYPAQKIAKGILEKPANQTSITAHLDGKSLLIHQPGEPHGPKDSTISQISAIMGGVQEVKKGDLPF